MQDDRFEWDDAKAQANLAKHKVSFEVACLVFEDPESIDEIDDRGGNNEERYNRTGFVNGIVIRVTYTEREQRFRIISARKATRREQEAYFAEWQ